jgi:hypothetical protein
MAMRTWTLLAAIIGLSLLLAGCGQRVSVEKIVTVDVGDVKAPIILDGPKSDQKIKVEFNSTDSPVTAQIIVGKDGNAIANELQKPAPANLDVKAKMENAKDGILETVIPAGKDYGVYLSGATKKTSVVVKVKSQ